VNVKPLARIVICLGVVLVSGTSGHTAESKRDRKQIEEMTRLQILLDNCDFGGLNLIKRASVFMALATPIPLDEMQAMDASALPIGTSPNLQGC
jgi:hypothetical protein